MAFYGYDPYEYARLKVGIMQQAGTNISQAVESLGGHVSSTITSAVAAKKADELQYSQATEARKDLINLLRLAQQYSPSAAKTLMENDISDPINLVGPPPKKGDLTSYLNKLSQLNTGLAISLARNPDVDTAELDAIMGRAGWSKEALKTLEAGRVEKYGMERSQLAGRAATELTSPSYRSQVMEPTPQLLGQAPPQEMPGEPTPEQSQFVSGPTRAEQAGMTRGRPEMKPSYISQTIPAKAQNQFQLATGMAERGFIEKEYEPLVSQFGQTQKTTLTSEKNNLEWARLALRKETLKQGDARLSYNYFKAGLQDAWQRGNQWGDVMKIVETIIRPRIDDLRTRREELETQGPPIGLDPEDQRKKTKEHEDLLELLKKHELEAVELLGKFQERASTINIPTGETGSTRLYGPTQVSGGQITQQEGGETPQPKPASKPPRKPKPQPTTMPSKTGPLTVSQQGDRLNPYIVTDTASYATVPKGAWYRDPNGNLRQKVQ